MALLVGAGGGDELVGLVGGGGPLGACPNGRSYPCPSYVLCRSAEASNFPCLRSCCHDILSHHKPKANGASAP